MAPRRTAGAKPSFSSHDPGADRAVDLLEVDVLHAIRVVRDELEVVGAAVGDMARVQAELDGLGIGAVEEALDLLLRPDVAVRVGVEHEHGAVLVGHVLAELGHARC